MKSGNSTLWSVLVHQWLMQYLYEKIDQNLLYYIYHFGGKAKAQQYFNKIIEKDKLRSKYIGFYNHLKDLPKESILLDEGEFYGADMIKFAFINGLEIDK